MMMSLRWVGLDNWTYTRTFTLPPDVRKWKRVNLVCDGLDTVATILLNNVTLGTASNMFRRYTFDSTDVIKERNYIEVRFVSAVLYAAERNAAHSQYSVPPDCPPPQQNGECHVNFIRKEQSSFSWDWGPSFPTQGIWKDIRIEMYEICHLTYLTATSVYGTSIANTRASTCGICQRGGSRVVSWPSGNVNPAEQGEAQVVKLFSTKKEKIHIEPPKPSRLKTAGARFSGTSDRGIRIVHFRGFVRGKTTEARNPVNFGRADLTGDFGFKYCFVAKAAPLGLLPPISVFSTITLPYGVWSLRILIWGCTVGAMLCYTLVCLQQAAQSNPGSNWAIRLPGAVCIEEKLFIKVSGTNSSCSNISFKRVLGRQEENHFGDWADLELLGRTVTRGQLGCRAWERTSTDEMAKTDGCVGYGCGRMCKSPRSVTDVPQYYFAVRVVRRLKSHPSIIIWSGNNENEAALATNWFHVSLSNISLYLDDYVQLYVSTIRETVLKEDRNRPYITSSPTNGKESIQEHWVARNPYDVHYGDVHYYSYDTDCWDWTYFPKPRFASEYGFQSWPSFSTLEKVSAAEDWSFNSSFVDHRQHQVAGNKLLLNQIQLHFQLPQAEDPLENFKSTIYLSQVMQAECIKAQTEFYRRSQSEVVDGQGLTMGTLYWQLNDIWQAPSWASIEYGGKWKMLHYFARNFFAPVLPVAFEDDGSLIIYGISDLSMDLQLVLQVRVYQWSSLEPVCAHTTEPFTLKGSSAAPVYKAVTATLLQRCSCSRDRCVIAFHLEDQGQQRGPVNYHLLTSLKDAHTLRAPHINASVSEHGGVYSVSLHSSSIAPYVWLDVGNIPGRFSDNAFLMLQHNKVLTFIPRRPTSTSLLQAALTIRTLHGPTLTTH
ncbi:LOW QUALITY PROTEIN: beta-mannosidase [Leucoraja erinacea]|uniref:LOW QUALITY PROTEIN: beta-mannosidase n=1 Tax=Leucoraja erinaceus TaxID=7782 RepID=UPI0024578046|nr:LOW QUALITY PROTEIN: beta-mannosidase [Leucoraja erinacea]